MRILAMRTGTCSLSLVAMLRITMSGTRTMALIATPTVSVLQILKKLWLQYYLGIAREGLELETSYVH